MSGHSDKSKIMIKQHHIFFAVCITFLVLFLTFACTASIPKPEATIEQVEEAISKYGYQVLDRTNAYMEQDRRLEKAIGFVQDDIHFNFFLFDNRKSAGNVYTVGRAEPFHNGKRGFPMIECETIRANVAYYSLDSKGQYTVSIQVGKTAVYAFCNSENKAVIIQIIDEIGYLE